VRDLRALFEPSSVAILGASNDPAKWGHWLALGALKGNGRRRVYLVNRNGGEILGQTAYPSLAELPDQPELVVVSLPATAFEQAVDDSLAAGAKAIVAISAGLGEMDESGRERERAVVERVRASGAVMLGPNCLGVFDAPADLDLASNEFPPGSIGLISQSGNIAIEIGLMAAEVGLGVSRFASLGNQADLEVADVVRAYVDHDATTMIVVYAEDFRDGRAFARAAQDAVRAGKPVLVLTVGASEASARAALSHTGALVSDLAAVDAACRAAGAVRAETPRELIDLVQAFLVRAPVRGRRVAVAGDGGGHGALAADLAAGHGLELPRLSEPISSRLAATLPLTATTRNPVDLAGGGEQDISSFGRVVSTLLDATEVDAVLLVGYFGGYGQYSSDFEAREVAAAGVMADRVDATGRPLVVHTMFWASAPAWALRKRGIPVFRDVGAAVSAIARLAEREEQPPWGVPDLPPAREPAAATGYFEARELIAASGIAFAEARRVTSWDEARSAAEELGFPLVLKALGPLHKSDQGGVVVGLTDEAALEQAYTDMIDRLGPPELSVEAMATVSRGVELIVGARRDARFGPIALVGAGGLYAEILADVAVALAPLDAARAEHLLGSLRIAPLLEGARGRVPLDVAAAGRAAAALSTIAAEHPEIAEIEVNPLLVTPSGAIGLDARVVLEDGADAR
jgi:acetate---CoA ligase (ADP-forming)